MNSATLQARSNLNIEEFFSLIEAEGDVTYELIKGQAVRKMSPKFFHYRLTKALLNLLELWCQQRGEVAIEWAIRLTQQDRDWVPVPDLLYISYERFPADWMQDDACPVAPELVIEIISPGQTFGQLVSKARDYLDAGVLRVWIVDSKARSITVFYPDSAPQTYRGGTPLTDSILEGLEITVEQVFQLARIPDEGSLF